MPTSADRRGAPCVRLPSVTKAGLLVLSLSLCAAAPASVQNLAASGAPAPEVDTRHAPPARPASPPAQRMRCWQHGRLLFEEYVSPLPESAARYRLTTPGGRSPVYLLDTGNGLCLVQSAHGSD